MEYFIKDEEFSIKVEISQNEARSSVVRQYIAVRKQKNMTQKQVASVSGIKRSNITRFESGGYNPTLDMMVKIAESMGMHLEINLVEK